MFVYFINHNNWNYSTLLLRHISKYRRGKTTIREELHVGYVLITNVVPEKVLSFMKSVCGFRCSNFMENMRPTKLIMSLWC